MTLHRDLYWARHDVNELLEVATASPLADEAQQAQRLKVLHRLLRVIDHGDATLRKDHDMTDLTDADLAAVKARADAATQMASHMRPGTTAHETIYGLGEDVPALLSEVATLTDANILLAKTASEHFNARKEAEAEVAALRRQIDLADKLRENPVYVAEESLTEVNQ